MVALCAICHRCANPRLLAEQRASTMLRRHGVLKVRGEPRLLLGFAPLLLREHARGTGRHTASCFSVFPDPCSHLDKHIGRGAWWRTKNWLQLHSGPLGSVSGNIECTGKALDPLIPVTLSVDGSLAVSVVDGTIDACLSKGLNGTLSLRVDARVMSAFPWLGKRVRCASSRRRLPPARSHAGPGCSPAWGLAGCCCAVPNPSGSGYGRCCSPESRACRFQHAARALPCHSPQYASASASRVIAGRLPTPAGCAA